MEEKSVVNSLELSPIQQDELRCISHNQALKIRRELRCDKLIVAALKHGVWTFRTLGCNRGEEIALAREILDSVLDEVGEEYSED